MKRFVSTLAAAGMLSLGMVAVTPAPAQAAAARCHVEIEKAGIIVHKSGNLSVAGFQRCTGTFAYQTVKVAIQKYVVRNNAPDGWVFVAQNQENSNEPYLRVIARKKDCNPRAKAAKYRAVGTGTVRVGRVVNGRSVIHPTVKTLRC